MHGLFEVFEHLSFSNANKVQFKRARFYLIVRYYLAEYHDTLLDSLLLYSNIIKILNPGDQRYKKPDEVTFLALILLLETIKSRVDE